MNENLDTATGLVDHLPAVDAEASTLVPVLAPADGVVVLGDNLDGDVEAGEILGYVQTGEDA